MKSTPFLAPKRKSLSSFSLIKGIDNLTFGTFTPFFVIIGPELNTSHSKPSSSLLITVKVSLPSLIRILFPTEISSYNSSQLMWNLSLFPSTSLLTTLTLSPLLNSTLSFSILPTLISGPLVSSMIPKCQPYFAFIFLHVFIFFKCSS